jgi:hypothetical protein
VGVFLFLAFHFMCCSFIGAILIVMGLYLVAWGQRAAILAAELLPATQDDDGVTSTTPTLLNLKEPLIVS